MMGEVVEDTTVTQQQQQQQQQQQNQTQVTDVALPRLPVNNTADEDDEEDDEEDAENKQKELSYHQRLSSLSMRKKGGGCGSSVGGSSSSNIISDGDGRKSSSSFSHSNLFRLINVPRKHLAKRRTLVRKHHKVLQGISLKVQLKSKREFKLKFLEAVYVRNALFQSLPHSSVSAATGASGTGAPGLALSLSSSSSSTQHLGNNAGNNSGDKSVVSSDSGKPNTNYFHHGKLFEQSDEKGDKSGRNAMQTDDSSDSAVPQSSAISEYRPYSGVWFNCLKSKAMNKREPDHLLKITYDNYVQNEARRLWLSKQKKKKKGSRASEHTAEPKPTEPLLPTATEEKSAIPSSPTSNVSSSSAPSKPLVDNNASKLVASTTTSSTSSSSSTLPSAVGAVAAGASSTEAPTPLPTPTGAGAAPAAAASLQRDSSPSSLRSPCSLAEKDSDQDQLGGAVASPLRREESSKTSELSVNPSTPSAVCSSDEITLCQTVVTCISKEELEMGRRPNANYLSTATLASLNTNNNNGGSGGGGGGGNNVNTNTSSSSKYKSSDVSKPGSVLSSNASDISVKSVISENTDSSSSASTNVSCSSFNDKDSSSIQSASNVPNAGSTSNVTNTLGLAAASLNHNNSNNSISMANNTTSNNNNSSNSNSNHSNNNGSSNNSSNSNNNSSDTNASSSSSSSTTTNHAGSGTSKSSRKHAGGPKPPKKYSEKMKAEASVVQRIAELQKDGMWWEKRLPKVYEPPKAKAHWDYLLEEMTWMAADFANERKWKRNAAKRCARMIEKYFHDKELKRQKAEKEEEVRKRKTAGNIAKLVRQFWSNVQTVVEFKEQTIIESMRKKALDQKLSYLVNETEKYSEIVAQTFTAIAQKTGIESIEEKGSEVPSTSGEIPITVKEEVSSPAPVTEENDDEFVPPSDSESDVDDTIAEEEAKEKVDTADHDHEIEELEAENNMSYEELLAKYSKYLTDPESYQEPQAPQQTPPPEPKIEPQRRLTRGRVQPTRQLRSTARTTRLQAQSKLVESDIETDVDDESTCTEEDSADESASEADKANDDLASLLKSISSSSEVDPKMTTEDETNKLADLAESFKPKGNTLSSTTVVTKVPLLLRHQLREYQHIGLDWLVTMYDKKLNGILADEMGLGKTIQTIALLAYLAEERGNWGPHLIIVPTSVMLNWEMEFKKWCPGFKILTYYGSQKERKLKRSGWTKPNAFHVCITSYKLVIQDHQSFRRKRWKYLILDEAQNIKNFKSQRWQLLLNFHSQRRLLLTGTPLQNNLMELWSLLHFLMPNVFQSHMEFKDWFSNPMSGMVEGSQEYNEDIVRRLHKVLRPFILRRMKSEVEKQLPQKYEHVVMCSLSKRQRYLYEEFMSRTKTRDTLNQGNLLSVINVLMQLRKVCNHPNLFEPRPIASPFQTEGINYSMPSCAWNMLRGIYQDTFRLCSPLFTITNAKYTYDRDEADRIGELTPLFAYNPDDERRYVVMNYDQRTSGEQPPVKRPKRIINLNKNEPPPCPQLQKPLGFFLSSGRPDAAVKDREFVEALGGNPKASNKVVKEEGSQKSKNKNHTKSKESKESGSGESEKGPTVVDLSDSENTRSSCDSDFEVVIVKKRKTPVNRLNIQSRLKMMGCSVPDFELDYIQERKLRDRKAVVDNLNKVNWSRCRVHSFVGPRLIENCRVVDSLPPLRLTSRRTGIRVPRRESIPRDFKNNGYFNLGFGEIMKLIRVRQENPSRFDHPLIMWTMTTYLESVVQTPERRVQELMDVLSRYVMYIPAVSAPSLEGRIYRPPCSSMYLEHIQQLENYRTSFAKPTEIVHPIVSRMLTQFPDPRLIQYDCGKLQTLDTLLRKLKTGSHRVLIFTQMAKVLDILEAFLNYHGHTYLRLDGATKIDQRQMLMERFNADKKIFCFILSTRSGGIGVNLTGADTVIFYDSDWNPTMDAQAQDRCHRIGQTRDVHIYRLVSEKTVEENILKKSNQKRLLGELAIEGGKFTTTYFKQNTIRDLFTINEKDDVSKRLSTWNTEQTKPPMVEDEDETTTFDPTDIMKSPEKKHEMQMIECALAAAEDDTDVHAAQTVHAEAEAEMAEFDENVSLDALDELGKSGPNKFEIEFQQVFERMTDVERYAMRLMEVTIDDWSKETVAQAQKDLEEQKLAWELQQQKSVQEIKMDIDDDLCNTEDLLTYSRVESTSQVWVAQFGSCEQDMSFMIYEPPTPPQDEMDVYFDTTHGYLYDYAIMSESQLPPVYVSKHPKKAPTPVSPVAKPGVVPGIVGPTVIEKTPEPPKEPVPEAMDVDNDASPSKKSPKVARREDPIFAPKSLFDRPTPAMAKLRRDLRLQRYSCRPPSASPKATLGPGSITFPIVTPGTPKTPPPPMPSDSMDWLIAEDYSLLQTVRNILELPPNLLVVNLAQTPNWDFGAEAVNMVGFSQRTQKQCKWRYENVVAPREEGKLLFDPPASASDPTSPSSGKKKKTKTFIKIAPPSPSKAARNVKVSQLLSQDNNAQYRNIFCAKFDTIKSIANKRAPTTKPITVNPQMKSSKHAQVFAEHGINYDSPLPATMIAQARYDRIQMERKKLEAQRQQAAVAAAAAASGTPIAPTGLAGVPATIVSSGPVVAAAAMATTNVNVNVPQNVPPKPRGQFTSITIPGTMPPIVLQGSPNPNELITRDAHVSISNMLAQQRRPEFTAQQQQQLIQLQQKQAIAQVQTMASQQQTIQQQNTGSPSPTPNVTILNAGSIGTTQSPQIVRQAAPVQVHPSSQPQTQTVVLASGLAQALAASVGSPITVSSSAISTTTTQLTSTVNTTNTLLPTIPRHLQPTSLSTQPQLQRVPTLTMQDIVSSANTQRIQAGIITTSASGLQSVGQPPQPTLVSLTPMMGTNNPQLTTKIIQNPQGIATLVQSSPRAGAPQITQQASKQLTPLQLQYLRQSGLIRQANPVSSSPVSQQQQVQAIKDQLVGGPQQIKRIQVVAAGPPPTIVTSSSMSSHPQATVSLPSISTIQSGSSYSAVPVIPSTSSPVVTLSGTASKQATMGQPPVSMASMAISSSVSAATASAVLSQQSQQRQVQLVKQHTVGGKTVTRPVTDAEVAAFLKHHGIPAITSAQGPLGGSKNPVATATFPNVQGQPTLLTVGLQVCALSLRVLDLCA
ncbi:unnamed protein product [Orchesella dallaii]|uniref:Helicase domino n=1 Tax=Orchesella dallaii TaxID=48710 RepID=A0ABP1Q056_9HEXA